MIITKVIIKVIITTNKLMIAKSKSIINFTQIKNNVIGEKLMSSCLTDLGDLFI